jgi:uncharacterized membrane protein YcaP (DUF421 family)
MNCLHQIAGHDTISTTKQVLFLMTLFMADINSIWGEGENINVLQMSVRAFVTFFIALIMIRFGGMRIFGKKSALDTIIVIMLGAVLARGIVGASDYWATVGAAAVMLGVNRLLAWASGKNAKLDSLFKGDPILLFDKGEIQWQNMRRTSLTISDLMEALRLEVKKDSLDDIEKAFIENNGRISFIVKDAK